MFKVGFILPKILSISLSTALDNSTALFKSAAFLPICSPLVKKNCSGTSPLGLKPETIVFKILSPQLRLYFKCFPRCATFLMVAPTPPMTPVSKAPSVPNLTLLTMDLAALSFPSAKDKSFNAVGPPNKSPSVPKSSVLATKTPSATPPATAPAANLATLPFLFNSKAFCPALASAGLLRVKYLPALADLIAALAALVPYLNAIPPGTPMLTRADVILPAVVASAFSSMLPNFL